MGAPALRAGYGSADVTPALGDPLGGVVTREPRRTQHIRDRLHARALALRLGETRAVLVAAEILVVTPELHAAASRLAGLTPSQLLISATHTHSGLGAYWAPPLPVRFMGPYDQAIFDRLAQAIADAAIEALDDLAPADIQAASTSVSGASANRREPLGPVDPELQLVRFERGGRQPIDLWSFGAHPVIGSELAPNTATGDWPGEVCRRLEAHGAHAIFFQGAVGGLSPLFPELPIPLETHLRLVSDLIETGVQRAREHLLGLEVTGLRARVLPLALPETACRVLPPAGVRDRLLEVALSPARAWVAHRAREARPPDGAAPVHLVELGPVALVGTPCDLGVRVALALKSTLRSAGVRHPLVGSQCDAYVGYVHLPEDYAQRPPKGFRQMGLYENAMSFSGWDLGARMVEAVRESQAT
ncbi:MAG: neutral/alkaline non-lysosomal ceramidase N-terminal domain-containing protein [Deltaproteobacteria bacterium]|nr:neutral/alkaline non-lysosomal ceramidase N-terminal domain-containing protein [Deltaproteobacteria bacterium]